MAGAVRKPCSFWIPIGTPFRDVIELAGGAIPRDFAVFVGGLMMGFMTFDLDDVVTKTTGGLIVLPKEHYLVERKIRPVEAMSRIGLQTPEPEKKPAAKKPASASPSSVRRI